MRSEFLHFLQKFISAFFNLNGLTRFTASIDGRARWSSAWSSKTRSFTLVTKRSPTINSNSSKIIAVDNAVDNNATAAKRTTPG